MRSNHYAIKAMEATMNEGLKYQRAYTKRPDYMAKARIKPSKAKHFAKMQKYILRAAK